MPRKNKDKININIPSLVSCDGFEPTTAMQKFAVAYIQQPELSHCEILRALGYSVQLWYQWQHKPGFKPWLQKVVSDSMSGIRLTEVYNAIYRRACDNSPQDAKLFLERFDKDYKPTNKTELEFGNKGQRPPSYEQLTMSLEAKRKAVLATVIQDRLQESSGEENES